MKSLGAGLRSTFLFPLFCAFTFSLFAQTGSDPYWLTLEKGKRLFRDGSYGDALLAFEDASRNRHDYFDGLEQSLIDVLSIVEVRRFGDALDLVEAYISDRKLDAPATALKALYRFTSKAALGNSAQAALDRLDSLKDYPEADYWIGEVYRVEGEYDVALSQYRKAYDKRSILETKEEARDILYRMADLCENRRDYKEMETLLLKIVAEDSLWTDSSQSFVRESMARTLANEGVDRFFTLYRHDSSQTSRAHRLLGFYYYSTGRHSRAVDHLTFAFLIQTTAIIDELKRLNFDWSFTSIAELLNSTRQWESLSNYLSDSDYYKTIYYLGAALFAVGKKSGAIQLWRLIVTRPDAGEWKNRAALQLKQPFVEPPSEAL